MNPASDSTCPCRLLLVEDDPGEVALMRSMLAVASRPPYQIDWAPGYHAALEATRPANHDVLLIDVRLGDGNGLDLIAELRRREIDIPALLITSYHDPALEDRALREGAADYLTKADLAPLALRRAIRNAVERHRIQRQLTRSERSYRLLASGFPNGCVLVSDPKGNLQLADGLACAHLGLSDGAGIGQPIARLLPDLAPAISRSLADRTLPRLPCEGRHGDRFYVGSANPLPDGAAQVALLDITELKALQLGALANDRLAMLGHIAGGVAHEFNNLHAIILGCVDRTLRKQEMSQPVREQLQLVRTTADRAAEVTRNLLGFARGDRGGDLPSCDVPDTIRETLSIIRGELESEGMHLDLHLDPVPPVMAQRAALGQVVMNLVLNARDALRGSAEPRIALTCLAEGTSVVLRLADNGPGIPPAIRSRIFDPFYTTKDGRDGRQRGTGLGLSLCRTILDHLGGAISVACPPEGGSVFTVQLPMCPGGLSDPNRHFHTVVPNDVPPGARVLVIEDDPHLRDLIGDELMEAGWRVQTAQDGESGLAAFAAEPADVVLVDQCMPRMQGVEVVQKLVQAVPCPRLVAISAHALDGAIIDLVDAVFAKPFDLATLRASLAGMLQRTR